MFKDGQKVSFKLGILDKSGIEQTNIGIIRGIASIDVAVLGKTYIIECIDGFIPNSNYDYKFRICTENRISLLN